MLENSPDVVKGSFAETTVLVSGECVISAFEDRLVNMHAVAVVPHERLGHKGCSFSKRMCHHVNGILVKL